MSFKIFKRSKEVTQKEKTQEWESFASEGELAIDAYETKKELVIQSPIAGITAKDISISVEDGMLIIKGKREKPQDNDKEKRYFYQECFSGKFSKRIILPEEVDINKAKATIKNGVLTLRIPKLKPKTQKQIKVIEEE